MKSISIVRFAVFSFAFFASLSACAQSGAGNEALQNAMAKMISIDGGTFKMGDMAEEGDANELPVHEVTVGDFQLAETEVTYELYDLFADSTGREKPGDEGWGRDQRPVTNVTKLDALALIDWLNEQTGQEFRLPSEAEWEYAARAGTETPFANGATITRDFGNYGPTDCCAKGEGTGGIDTYSHTAPVGSFEPNQWGLHDTVGNVWEWIADCYNETYAGAPTDGSAWMEGDCTRSPLRGGSWSHYSRNVRPANRNENLNDKFSNGYGIRLAHSL